MSQIYSADGNVVPVTVVQAGPCVVTQVTENMPNGNRAIQIGFAETKKEMKKPQVGHLKDLPMLRHLREFTAGKEDTLKRGDKFGVEIFKTGEKVEVIGTSKGKGFQGVVKRHGFSGGPASHGHKDNERAPGSIGAGGVQRVFKGMRMAGHMGSDRVTIKNLEVVEVDTVNNILKIKGALPGSRNSLVIIQNPAGVMKAAA